MITSRMMLALLITIAISCNDQSSPATHNTTSKIDCMFVTVPDKMQSNASYKGIYDFMQLVIADQHLDLSFGLSVEPESNCDVSEIDRVFLNRLISEPDAHPVEARTGDSPYATVTMSPPFLEKCLTRDDVSAMLKQKESMRDFRWDVTRLGFNSSNKENWYAFSVPLFSHDSTIAVMRISSLCPGLCGTGNTILFKKSNNSWTSQSSGGWYH